MADRQFLEQLTKRLANEGRLIEAGWVSLRLAVIPLNAPPAQLDDMRLAFMAGAQHLFSSMIEMLDPGSQETPDDLRRMDLINDELEAFAKEIELRARKPEGNA